MSKTIQNGGFTNPLGQALTGNLLLVLSQDAKVAATPNQVAPIATRIAINAGNIAPTLIYFNDELLPNNTYYTMTAYDAAGNKVYGPEQVSFTGAGPLDLGTLTPLLISPDPLFSNPVLQNPVQAQTITGFGLTLTSSAPLTVQGSLTSSGGGTLSGGFTGTFATLTIPPSVGISTANAVTLSVANPAAPRTYTLPDFGANDSFVGLAATQTLVGKTLTAPVINGGSINPVSLLLNATAPTIAAAGCGGGAASIIVSNGPGAFKVNVGTTPGSACTLTLPAATTGWNCSCNDITTQSTAVFVQKQTGAESTTSVTITNFNDVAVATAFVASDILKCSCLAD